MKRNTAQKIVIATAVMLAAGLGYLIIRLIVRHWRYVCPWSFFTIISLVVAVFIFQAVKGEEDFARTRQAWWIAGIVFCLLECLNFQSAFFHYHIDRLEKQFIYVARTAPRDITDDRRLNYYGELDKIIVQKNRLLRRYHYRDLGGWWVDTERGPEIRSMYEWSPFGLL
ncbi:MAG: hypothetical protein AAB785_03015 [Patescibacteria group bacterium]